MIAKLKPLDVGAQLGDYSRSLVSHHEWRSSIPFSQPHVQVTSTNSRGGHAHAHLAGTRVINLNVLDF
ncbi:MAG TPA: hypothetical protein VNF24_06710 [Candidatus Acidoferrales bacterium]|nr:hypothetical protein [Candidatus Acidoferrales bacterium]